MNGKESEIEVDGPETLTQTEIAKVAFEVSNKPLKITFVPDWIRRVLLSTAKFLLSSKKFGPIDFFMSVMAMEMTAPEYGERTLKEYFYSLKH